MYYTTTKIHGGKACLFLKTEQELRAELQVPSELSVELAVLKMSKLMGLPIAGKDGGANAFPELVEATGFRSGGGRAGGLVISRGRAGSKRKQQRRLAQATCIYSPPSLVLDLECFRLHRRYSELLHRALNSAEAREGKAGADRAGAGMAEVRSSDPELLGAAPTSTTCQPSSSTCNKAMIASEHAWRGISSPSNRRGRRGIVGWRAFLVHISLTPI
ncbi:MAG: hypothetical protein SGPRY_003789 [Prymnesium sp.]